MSKFSDCGPLRSLKICPKVALIFRCKFFVTGTLCARAISIAEVDVREGSVAVWVGTKVAEIDAKEVLRVV